MLKMVELIAAYLLVGSMGVAVAWLQHPRNAATVGYRFWIVALTCWPLFCAATIARVTGAKRKEQAIYRLIERLALKKKESKDGTNIDV